MRVTHGIGALLLSTLSLSAIAQTPSPAFEVASVKPNNSGDISTQFDLPGGGRFTATNATARELVRLANQVQDYMLVGLPDWTRSARFDISARVVQDIRWTSDPGKPAPVFLMMRAELADRFKLVVRTETREMPVYAMVMARADRRLGPRLTASTTDCVAIIAAARKPGAAPMSPSDAAKCRSGSEPAASLVVPRR